MDFVETNIRNIEKQLTRHTKRSPQSTRVFLALFELHASHSDNLTHQKKPRPHQVTSAEVLKT